METSEQADSGYPEEGPPGSEPGGDGESAVRERSERRAQRESDNDERKPDE